MGRECRAAIRIQAAGRGHLFRSRTRKERAVALATEEADEDVSSGNNLYGNAAAEEIAVPDYPSPSSPNSPTSDVSSSTSASTRSSNRRDSGTSSRGGNTSASSSSTRPISSRRQRRRRASAGRGEWRQRGKGLLGSEAQPPPPSPMTAVSPPATPTGSGTKQRSRKGSGSAQKQLSSRGYAGRYGNGGRADSNMTVRKLRRKPTIALEASSVALASAKARLAWCKVLSYSRCFGQTSTARRGAPESWKRRLWGTLLLAVLDLLGSCSAFAGAISREKRRAQRNVHLACVTEACLCQLSQGVVCVSTLRINCRLWWPPLPPPHTCDLTSTASQHYARCRPTPLLPPAPVKPRQCLMRRRKPRR